MILTWCLKCWWLETVTMLQVVYYIISIHYCSFPSPPLPVLALSGLLKCCSCRSGGIDPTSFQAHQASGSVQIQRRHFRNSKIRDLSFLVFLLYASPFQLPWWGCAPHFVATNWIGGWWYLIKLTQIPLGVAWKPLCPPEWATIDDVWSENAKTYGISHSVWPCLVEPLEPLLLT